MTDDSILRPNYNDINLSSDQSAGLTEQIIELNKLLVEKLNGLVDCTRQNQEGCFACRE